MEKESKSGEWSLMEIQEADKRGRVRKIYQSRSTGVANEISELRNTIWGPRTYILQEL